MPQALTPDQVLQIAIEADKYNFAISLRYASIQWLKPSGILDMAQMGYLTASALLFGDSDAFASRTLALVLDYTGPYLELLDDERVRQFVPYKLLYQLEERRTRLRAELAEVLSYWVEFDCKCGWGKTKKERSRLLQSEYGPLRMLEVPISELIGKMKAIPEEKKRKYCNEVYRTFCHEVPTHKETFRGKLEDMEKKASICIDQVHS